MNTFKKSLMVAMVALLSITGSALAAGCQSCAEKMAIKQSIQAAAAAALAANNAAKRCHDVDSLEDVKETDGKPCCQSCAEGKECEGKRCPCNKPSNNGNKPSRADRDSQGDADLDEVVCLINELMERSAYCCKNLKDKIKHQGHEAEKCCRKVRAGLSVVETNIGDLCTSSVIDIPFPSMSIVDTVDASCLDMLTWLKSIYAVVAQIYYCTCNI